MSANELLTKLAPSYYPINIRIAGKKVFVFGGQSEALSEILRLLDFGANVDVVAPHIMAELQDLAFTYGDRITIQRRVFGDQDRLKLKNKDYLLAFALDDDDQSNVKVVESAIGNGVLAFGINDGRLSSFATATLLKRGHVKIAVSADTISKPIERAILRRIEALFVSNIDNYILFLNRLNDRLNELTNDPYFSDRESYFRLTRQLDQSEEILLAVQRQSFDEADALVDRIVLNCRADQEETL